MLLRLFLFLSCVLAAASDSCSSKLDADCAKEIKQGTAACKKCAEAHEAKLRAAGCTTAEVKKLCGAPAPPGPTPSPEPSSTLERVNFVPNATQGTLCEDGTAAGYYFRASTTAESVNKWAIYFEGGANPTSSNWKPTMPLVSDNFGAGFGFETWNQVYFATCSHSSRAGQRLTAENGSYFQGHLHIVNWIAEAKKNDGLGKATQMLVGGCSGGGLSQVINLDYIASQLPSSCGVRAWINSGLHFDIATYPQFVAAQGRPSKADEKPLVTKEDAEMLNAFVDESCRAALGDDWYKCIAFDHAFPYISTPAFVAQSQFDQHQLSTQKFPNLGVPPGALQKNTTLWANETTAYVAYFGRRSLEVFVPLLSNLTHDKGGALWMPSCLNHCKGTRIGAPETVRISSGSEMNITRLFHDWYSGTLETKPAIYVDACAQGADSEASGVPCNKAAQKANAFSCV